MECQRDLFFVLHYVIDRNHTTITTCMYVTYSLPPPNYNPNPLCVRVLMVDFLPPRLERKVTIGWHQTSLLDSDMHTAISHWKIRSRFCKADYTTLPLIHILLFFVQNSDGEVIELHAHCHPHNSGTKPKAYIHWVSDPLQCTVRLYDKLYAGCLHVALDNVYCHMQVCVWGPRGCSRWPPICSRSSKEKN